MGQRLDSFIEFEQIGIVKGNHVTVTSEDDHELFMDQRSMAVPGTGLLAQNLAFLFAVDNLRKTKITLLIARLLPK